nr:MAG TPA: hypothetical protein [Caudoviricetes sp.]
MDKKFVCIVADMYYCAVQGIYINRMPCIHDIPRYSDTYVAPDIVFPGDNDKMGVMLLDDIIRKYHKIADLEEVYNMYLICANIEDGIITDAKLDMVIKHNDEYSGEYLDFVRLDIDLLTNELQKKLLENIYTKWLVKDINFPTHLNQIEESLKLTDEEKRELLS